MAANLAWVAAGGAVGAVLRYLLSLLMRTGGEFPAATLAVNIGGSLAIGLVWGAWGSLAWFQEWGRAFLAVGILGGFTTFSAFSMEVLTPVQMNRPGTAALYVLCSLCGCLLAVSLGYRLAVA